MKIPETNANIGGYYGNEENGQWQPNGVMLDTGVGGGVVGSGDAGVQRPMYPVHMPRQHMPGYVMAGAYYPPAPYAAPVPDDFADYMWMENEEEFDKQVMQQLEEEALMEQCIEAMLEDEQRERLRPNGHQPYPTTSNGAPSLSLEETVSRSRLNPLAAEFVPVALHSNTEEKQDTPEAPSTESPQETTPQHEDTTTQAEPQKDPTPPPADPPEVSAADVQTLQQTEDKRKHKPAESKKGRDTRQAKSDSKLVTREDKDVKEVRTQSATVQPTPTPTEEPSGPKPINYAAAAKANKPKKASPPSPPATDKASPPPAPPKLDKKKVDKPVQRKNSAK